MYPILYFIKKTNLNYLFSVKTEKYLIQLNYMAKEKINVVKIDTDPAKKSLKDLRKELQDIRNEMVNLEEGSDAFLEMAQKGGELQHQIQEIGESIRGSSSDFGDMVGNVSNVAAGLVGAFNAVSGALQAMGVESEALDKTIARMQGLMAVVQGLGSIDTAIKSLDKLRNSITATSGAAKILKSALTPKIFLGIVAAVSALSLVFGKLGKNAKEVAERERERAEAYKQMKLDEEKRKQEEYNTALQRELTIKEKIINIKYGNDDVAKIQELIKLYQKELADLEAQLKNKYRDNEKLALSSKIRQLEKDLKTMQEGTQEYWQTLIEITSAEAELNDIKPYSEEEIKNLEARIAEFQKKITDAKYDLKEAQALKKVNDEEAAKRAALERAAEEARLKEDEKERQAEKLKNYQEEEKIINHLITLYAELNANNPNELAKENLNLEQRRLANIKSYYGEMSEEYKAQLIIVRDLEAAYAKLTETKEESLSNTEIELALENDRLKEMAKGWLYNEETALETFDRISDELKTALDRDLITQQQYDTAVKNLAKERSRYIVDQSSKAFTATANLATTILDGLADSQDKSNKEGFEKSKKLQIASATINMLSGITAAIAGLFTTKSGPWDIALAAIQAATIAASGAIQINKIKQTKFDGASGTSANISGSASSAMIIPPVQYSNAVTGASIDGNIKDSRVYVTETDIKNTMNKVYVQEHENVY